MKALKILFLVGLAVYLIALIILYFYQESLIFMDSQLPKDYKFALSEKDEEINLTTDDGAFLNGVHYKAPNSKGVVLYFHGNAEDISRWGEIVQSFLPFNYDVLLVDYRGYGKSRGKRSSKKLYKDASLWYEFLNKNYSESEIVVYGRSIGCTFATHVAANNQPKKLILETPFYSLKSIVDRRFPILPTSILLRFQLPTYQFITDVSCPITFIHGTEDKVVPYANGKRLFEKAKDATFVTIEGGAHNNLANFEEYWKEIEKQLSE